MPRLSLLEKRKQRFQLGQYLRANGLQSKPLGAFPERIGRSTQRIQTKKVI